MLAIIESSMGTFTFHHVGVAVLDLQSATQILESLFRYRLTSGPFDDPIQSVSVSFLSRGQGDTVIELVAPFGADSPMKRTLQKGGGTYSGHCPNCRLALSMNHDVYSGTLPDP